MTNSSGTAITSTTNIANRNPLRYRGYYYDKESGFYYLQSRYYDPEIKRFINADDYASTGQGFLGHNMFAYCGNNPVSRIDADGEAFETIFDIISLATSVASVIANPYDIWNWAGLAGDLIDLVPFVTGIGETVKVVRVVAKADELADVAKLVDKAFDGAEAMHSTLETGRKFHRLYDPIQDCIDGTRKLLNGPLTEFGSRLRPDAVDFVNNVVYELKPFNQNSFSRAIKQVGEYLRILGDDFTIVIDMYKIL